MRRLNLASLAVAAALLGGLSLDARPVVAADEVGLLTNLAQEPLLVEFQERAKEDGALGFYVDESRWQRISTREGSEFTSLRRSKLRCSKSSSAATGR